MTADTVDDVHHVIVHTLKQKMTEVVGLLGRLLAKVLNELLNMLMFPSKRPLVRRHLKRGELPEKIV